jgi:hypothetical protein
VKIAGTAAFRIVQAADPTVDSALLGTLQGAALQPILSHPLSTGQIALKTPTP